MRSPFPGMDPFIEARGGLWKDFHDDLISGIKHTLAPLLPENYVVRTGERSYVERIDVERPRFPMSGKWPPTPYYLLVSRKQFAPACKVWPAGSLRPLPEIPIPLAPPDADVNLNLQPLVDEIYARARYHLDIDYKQIPATLDASEVAWLEKKPA